MNISEAVTKRIDELPFKYDWSLYKLSKELCIPLSTLKNLYTKHTNSPSLLIIFKIAQAFNMTQLEFLDSTLFRGIEE